MKLTIDSTESLHDTLRVVGALYDVTLEVSDNPPADAPSTNGTAEATTVATTAAAPRTRNRSRTSRKLQPRKRQARAATNGRSKVDSAAVRAWARESGYEIADRGRVSAKLLTAYKQAHSS